MDIKKQDKEANTNLWDEKAEHFGNYIIPTMENDKFIKLLKEENLKFLYVFNMLYLKGDTPKINYEYKTWSYKEPLKKANNIYIKNKNY